MIERVFTVRQRYWERLFPAVESAPIPRLTADILATEAKFMARHMQVVDVLAYVDFTYLTGKTVGTGATVGTGPTKDADDSKDTLGADDHQCADAGFATNRAVEYALLLRDVVQRMVGHTIGERPSWPGRRCIVTVGEAIDVERAARSATRRAAVAALQLEIERALQRLSETR